MLVNDVTPRHVSPSELAKGWGLPQSCIWPWSASFRNFRASAIAHSRWAEPDVITN